MNTIVAQIIAECRIRLRSTRTIVAALIVFAVSLAYIPDPASRATTISWTAGGKLYAGVYNSAYIGASVFILSSLLLSLVGFYLISGTIERDRRTRVWQIVAATPSSRISYLLGKFVANYVYLLVISMVSLVAGMVAFARFGVGAFHLRDFLLPFAILTLPGLGYTAAWTLLFDVTPGLRSRAGYVIWFFVWGALLIGDPGEFMKKTTETPFYDPFGIVTFQRSIKASAGTDVQDLSFGYIIHDKPVTRVEWKGVVDVGDAMVARLASMFGFAPILLIAMLIFGRGEERLRLPEKKESASVRAGPAAIDWSSLTRAIDAAPNAWNGILADALLLWRSANVVFRFGLLAAVIVSLVVPSSALGVPIAMLLLLLIPVISEGSARETIAGTESMVFSQPGVPRNRFVWKLAASALFVFTIAAPSLLRLALAEPQRALTYGAALASLSLLATSLGFLTAGGKIFSGAATILWYLALQRQPDIDFTGVFAVQWVPRLSMYVLLSAVVLSLIALTQQKLRGEDAV